MVHGVSAKDRGRLWQPLSIIFSIIPRDCLCFSPCPPLWKGGNGSYLILSHPNLTGPIAQTPLSLISSGGGLAGQKFT